MICYGFTESYLSVNLSTDLHRIKQIHINIFLITSYNFHYFTMN